MFYIFRRKGLGAGTCRAIYQELWEKLGILCTILRSDKPQPEFTEDDVVLRWGCTAPLSNNLLILNKSAAIHKVNNKTTFRQHLQEKHPKIVPKTWYDSEDNSITYPCILRHKIHAQGKHLWFCTDQEQLGDADEAHANKYHTDDFYISEYIPKVKEYRVCFIQGRVAWVAEKIPKEPDAIAWNVAQGSKFINVRWKDWPLPVLETALIAHNESGLYLSGVDVMVDKDNTPYVLEVNSAPSHTSPYRQLSTTKCIGWSIKNNIYTALPLNTEYNKYMKYIHPGLT